MTSSDHIQIMTISLTSILLDTTKQDQNKKESVSVVHGLEFGHFKGTFDLEICSVPNSLCLFNGLLKFIALQHDPLFNV